MKTEVRFLLAIFLMLGVLVGTNLLFPPIVPDPALVQDSLAAAAAAQGDSGVASRPEAATGAQVVEAAPELPNTVSPSAGAVALADSSAAFAERRVAVETPLYRWEFSNVGARLVGAEMLQFDALNQDGLVDLIPAGGDGFLGHKLVVGSDTVDLNRVPFQVEPEDGMVLNEGGGVRTLRFTYRHPTQPFGFEVEYEFHPDEYMVGVRGRVTGLDRPLLVTDLGDGLAYVEADSANESRSMAYVYNQLQEGIESTILSRAKPTIVEGPLIWAAFRSKFFVFAMLAGESEELADETSYLGGLLVGESTLPGRVHVAAAQTVGNDDEFAYRLFAGPQEYALLSSLGQDMEEVNPYGWKFLRPVVRPIVSVVIGVLNFLHDKLNIGYGWVLIVFGVAMRIVLFPLNQKAMRAQLRNMAAQPLVQEIQAKYKDNPEKMQKEMMKLYKEHGFNPVAGCLPMLLPWPVLVALFFVFQNTIELRGVPFLWLPDLSAPDPMYLLPVFLGLSMFAMQWVSLKSLDKPNPQMKMMMWLMPGMMVFIFFKLASGLNLYYATANIATIPQQIWIANERKKMRAKPPLKMSDD
jgi:YidC/Oxa1 family membrane protein insertase